MKIDHVLIGGSGFIARHLREELTGAILILDKNKPLYLKTNESFLKLDIRQKIQEKFHFTSMKIL
jgi:nucleoside-diphosphate-sugar epimerase